MTREKILDLLAGDDTAAAIAAPGRPTLDRGGLARLMATSGKALRRFGVGPRDVVAMVVPNGPEAATSFLAVASHAVSAPLNPAYTEAELAFYLDDLGAKLVIVPAGGGEAARRVAAERGIAIAEMVVDESAPAGIFELRLGGNRDA